MKQNTNFCIRTFAFLLAITFLFPGFAVFAQEEEDSICEQSSIELNTAQKEELELLPGVGPVIAERIVEARPFEAVDSLIGVSGIGEDRLAQIKEQGCAWIDASLLEEEEDEESEEGVEEQGEFASSTIFVDLRVEGPDILVEKEDLEVADACEVTVVDEATGEKSLKSFSGDFLGICALTAGHEQEIIDSFLVLDFGWGLMLDSVNGLAGLFDEETGGGAFWALEYNGEEAMVGIADLVLADGDDLSLLYTLLGGEEGEQEDEQKEEDEEEPQAGNTGGSGGSGGSSSSDTSDVDEVLARAVAFLQTQDSSPDRVMALMAAGKSVDVSFLKSFSGDSAIDYAKPILALTAVGENPRAFPDEDWVAKMKSFADNTQLGDPSLLNDDIWGILALRSAGAPASDPVVQNSKAFLLQNQNADGGWSWGVRMESETDMTASAVAGLLEAGAAKSSVAIVDAIAYVKGNQNNDGGFAMMSSKGCNADWCSVSNTDTTAQVVLMINKLGEDPASQEWTKNPNPIEFLVSLQDKDGGGFWATEVGGLKMFNPADAVIALLGKSFPVNSIVVSQEAAQEQSGGGVGVSMSAPTREVVVDTVEFDVADEAVFAQMAEQLEEIARELADLERQVAALAAARAAFAAAEPIEESIPAQEPLDLEESSFTEEDNAEVEEPAETAAAVLSDEFPGSHLRAEAAGTGFVRTIRQSSFLAVGLVGFSLLGLAALWRSGFVGKVLWKRTSERPE